MGHLHLRGRELYATSLGAECLCKLFGELNSRLFISSFIYSRMRLWIFISYFHAIISFLFQHYHVAQNDRALAPGGHFSGPLSPFDPPLSLWGLFLAYSFCHYVLMVLRPVVLAMVYTQFFL